MSARLAVDIGGTFTDVVLETGLPGGTSGAHALKVLTTTDAPERGVMDGVRTILAQARCRPADVSLVVHGTTLATNALIERKGALTALVTTEGFRDSLEIAWEHRFEQYDIYMERPEPLVPRNLRFGVPERVAADGAVLLALDEQAVRAIAAELRARKVEAVAVCFLHSFTTEAHERRAGAILAEELPGVAISLSCDVCPEIREYERTSTTIANAYVLPRMAGYLGALETELKKEGIAGPLLLMMSSGGITTVDTARRYPVRLVESGPAGGAILALTVAAENGLAKAVAFDMGGTTAKLTLLDDLNLQRSRQFEVARAYRFVQGSGLPVRIPVIELVEIGAGGGSIARLDALGRLQVGPDFGRQHARSRLLRQWRHRAYRHRRRYRAGPPRSQALRRRRHPALSRQGRGGAAVARCTAQDRCPGRGRRRRRDRRRDHGQCGPCACRGERQGHRRAHPDRLRRRSAAPCRAARPQARHEAGRRAGRRRSWFGLRLPARADRL